jgi:hypothetical protein
LSGVSSSVLDPNRDENFFNWNLDNFQIDLTHGLGSDSFLTAGGANRNSDPWGFGSRNSESQIGSVNLSRNSLADSSGVAALNNQVSSYLNKYFLE